MRVYVSLEHRYVTSGGAIYDNTVHGQGFWDPYLEVFDEVVVVARAPEVALVDESYRRVDNDRVSFEVIPDYRYSPHSLAAIPGLVRRAREIAGQSDALIIRAPCRFGHLLWRQARKTGRPYGVEMVGDLWDASEHSQFPMKMLNRHVIVPIVARQCREAAVASYVTRSYLQRRAAPGPKTQEFVWSDNRVSRAHLRPEPRVYNGAKPLKLVYTANLVAYKGHTALVDVVRRLTEAGVDSRLTLIGDGPGRNQIERAVQSAGISDRVYFAGRVRNDEVLRILEENDLYVSTSFQEGLPRAVVEAQARALPVAAFATGGIPELVPEEYLTAPGDAAGLSQLIVELARTPEKLSRGSAASLSTAARYVSELQEVERRRSYEALREACEEFAGR